jgi:hypothetical protein
MGFAINTSVLGTKRGISCEALRLRPAELILPPSLLIVQPDSRCTNCLQQVSKTILMKVNMSPIEATVSSSSDDKRYSFLASLTSFWHLHIFKGRTWPAVPGELPWFKWFKPVDLPTCWKLPCPTRTYPSKFSRNVDYLGKKGSTIGHHNHHVTYLDALNRSLVVLMVSVLDIVIPAVRAKTHTRALCHERHLLILSPKHFVILTR